MLKTTEPRFQALMAEVAKQLVGITHEGTNAFVRVPILYPSGSTAVVRVRDETDAFFVTDMGMGWDECEMMGATHGTYTRHARQVAQAAGVGFDNHAFFVMRVSKDQIPGAIMTIATCSIDATAQVSYALTQKRQKDENEILYQRLKTILTPRRATVSKDVEIIGASTHDWTVGSLVISNDNRTIFEAVSVHGNSVASVVTKFGDIARLESAPDRVAVVRSKQAMGSYLGVLSPVGRIIEHDAPEKTILSLARVA